ncbi:MAG: Ig-like domain-containing protein [Verrucomicrobiales bacterium]
MRNTKPLLIASKLLKLFAFALMLLQATVAHARFELVSPPHGSIDKNLRETLDWDPLDRATGYRVEVRKNSNNELIVSQDLSSGSTQYTIPEGKLNYLSAYKWRVIGYRTGGNVILEAFVFSTKGIPACQIESPLSGTADMSLAPLFNWRGANSVDRYQIQILQEGVVVHDHIVPHPATSYSFPGTLNEATEYTWRVQAHAQNAEGTPIWNEWTPEAYFITRGPLLAPSLVSPPNGSNDQPLRVNLQWQAVTGATKYRWELWKIGGSKIAGSDSTEARESGNIELQEATEYLWKVQAFTSRRTSPWSEGTFATRGPLQTPLQFLPADKLESATASMTFSWSQVPFATAYELDLRPGSLSNERPIQAFGGLVSSPQTLAADTTYFWRVRARTSLRESPWSEFRWLTTKAPMQAPRGLNPNLNPGERIDNLRTKLSWNDVDDESGYRVEYEYAGAAPVVLSFPENTIETKEITFPPDTLVKWRVQSFTGLRNSPWREAAFTTRKPLSQPALRSPEDQAVNSPLNTRFSWGDVEGATRYIFTLHSVYDGVETLVTNITQGQTSLRLNLKAGTTYKWTVRGGTTAEHNAPSSSRIFTTIGKPQPLFPEDGFKNLPAVVRLSWNSIKEAGAYRFEVYDDNGEIAASSGPIAETFAEVEVQPGRTYRWRIQGVFANNPWSEYYSFTTASLIPPTPPLLLSPFNGQTDVALDTPLTWAPASGASRYLLQVLANGELNRILVEDGQTSYLYPLQPNTTYSWAVGNSSDSETVFSDSFTFTTCSQCDTIARGPNFLTPNNAQDLCPEITLEWERLPGQPLYYVEISENGSPSETQLFGPLDVNHFRFNGEVNKSYTWRVRAVSPVDPAKVFWSAYATFSIKGNSLAIISQPVSQTVVAGGSVQLTVNVAGAGPEARYQWRKNGENIQDANNAVLTLGADEFGLWIEDSGTYDVEVSDGCLRVTSDPATITVDPEAEPLQLLVDQSQITETYSGYYEARRASPVTAQQAYWMRWKAQVSGLAEISSLGSTMPVRLAAYEVKQEITANRSALYNNEIIRFNVVGGVDYLIRVEGYAAAAGDVVISWYLEEDANYYPNIETAPKSLVVLPGATAQFNVNASIANGTVNYLWRHNGREVPGANTPSLTINNVASTNVGLYEVEVSSQAGKKVLAKARLEIGNTHGAFALDHVPAPSVQGGMAALPEKLTANGNSFPAPITVSLGSDGLKQFSSYGYSTDPQDKNCSILTGGSSAYCLMKAETDGMFVLDCFATSPNAIFALTPPNNLEFFACNQQNDGSFKRELKFPVKAGQEFNIYCDTAMGEGTIFHLKWRLQQGPQFTTSMQDKNVNEGDNVELSSPAEGKDIAYVWYKNGVAIRGAYQPTFTISKAGAASSGVYKIVAISPFGSATNQMKLVVNAKPNAGADLYQVNEDESLVVEGKGVGENDSDPENSPLVFQKVSEPAHGSLKLNSDGSFTYQPAANFAGEDRFDYVASDQSVQSDVQTVTIRVHPKNDPPVLGRITSKTIPEGNRWELQLNATDIDTETGALRFRFASEAPEGMILDGNSGLISWTPSEAQGPATFNVTAEVNDGELKAAANFTIQVLEQHNRPALLPLNDTAITAGTALQVRVQAVDHDLPVEALSFRLLEKPEGMTIEERSGTIKWLPTTDQSGDYRIIVEVEDSAGLTDSITFKVIVKPAGAVKMIGPVVEANALRFTFEPALSQTFILQSSPDMKTWTEVAELTTGTTSKTAPINPNEARMFFRLMAVQ